MVCGRYTVTQPKRIVRDLHGEAGPIDWSQRFNVAPGHVAPVVVSDKLNPPKLLAMSWGFAGPRKGLRAWSLSQIINVRVETAHQKLRFREAFHLRRCVVLADGFYEWRRMQGQKQPYLFRLENRVPFGFAGIWECTDKVGRGGVPSFAILTTVANQLVGELHERMPVILDERKREDWLDYDASDDVLRGMLEPFPDAAMERIPVSHYVNNPNNEGSGCIERIAEPEVDTLFS